MAIIGDAMVRRMAREHARLGIKDVDAVLTARKGLSKDFRPDRDPRDMQIVEAMNSRVAMEEMEDDLRNRENDLSRHGSIAVPLIVLGFFFVVECLGAVLVMRSLGLGNPERAVLGVALAAVVFMLTWAAANGSNAGEVGASGKPRRSPWFVLGLLAYGVLVAAIAVIRVNELSDAGEGSRAYDIAAGIIMVAATVGPAWIAEMLMRRLAPAMRLRREAGRLRGRLRRARRQHQWGQKRHLQRGQEAGKWNDEAARLKAIYEVAHKVEAARVAAHGN